MKSTIARFLFGLGAAISLADCARAEKPPVAEGQSYRGWYMEHAGQGVFQSCGQSQTWRVSGSAELRVRAREFGLAEDTPVYVRLVGLQTKSGDGLQVSRVEQFGSKTPVRDCALTGIVIPEPLADGD